MLFNSIEFAIFLPIVFTLYWFVVNKNLKLQNVLLLLASYFFYGWWDWRFLFLILISSFTDYFVGLGLLKESKQKTRRILLLTSLFVNLGMLGFFKYYNFFVGSFSNAFTLLGQHLEISRLNIILPIGISFYTFKTLGYTIDVYKGKIEPTKNILTYLNFVSFFPELLAGPIDRANNLLPQFDKPRVFDYNNASLGIKLILSGLFKKMVIADSAAVLVNRIYDNPSGYVGLPMVVATVFFAFQIYCDFSGYSEIAIGTGKLLGFNLMNNFNKPYFSASLTEFWKRWHISLTTWFRDFVFLPTAFSISWRTKGERVILLKKDLFIYIAASAITWMLTGLWHGANYTFIIWGGLHGLILVVEHLFRKNKFKSAYKAFNILKTWFNILLTFTIVCFTWIFFRANSLPDAGFIIKNMFSDVKDYSNLSVLSTKFRGLGLMPKDLFILIFFILFMLGMELLDKNGSLDKLLSKRPFFKWSYYYLLLVFILFFGTANAAANFIYFQF
jgi:D-alanyl-lipoteichoic acid acyltransferase DltB (MBOAT superfamily)